MATQTYWIDPGDGSRKKRVPSVTTVLKLVGDKGALMNWQFMQGKDAADMERDGGGPFMNVWAMPKGAAMIGTIVHAMIEADLAGVEFDKSRYSPWPDEADVAFTEWPAFRESRKIEPISAEESMVSVKYEFGGRPDLIAKIDGRITLVDFKVTNGLYPDHIRQLAAYSLLWAENHPDVPLESVLLLQLGKVDGSLGYKFWRTDSPTMVVAARSWASALQFYKDEAILKKAV